MQRSAFTLVELLVVITVIAVLLGMLFPAITMVRNAVYTTAAASRAAQLDVRCRRTRTEDPRRLYPDEDPSGQGLLLWNPNPTAADTGLLNLLEARDGYRRCMR